MADSNKKLKKFNSDEIANFSDQTAMLLNSGVTIDEGMHMLFAEVEDKNTGAVLHIIDEKVSAGSSFNEALSETGAFPEYFVHMVKVGEDTGKLEDVMRALSVYYERESRTKQNIKSAVTYPSVLFAMMTVIIVVLVWKILPLFENMLAELNKDVAEATRRAMNAGLTAGKVVAVVTCVLLAVLVAGLLWYRTTSGEKAIRSIAGKIGFTRKTGEIMATGKFVSSLALMVSSGIDVREAIASEADACTDKTVRKKLDKCLSLFDSGISYDEALREAGILSGVEARLVNVAVKTGSADAALTKLGEQYSERTDKRLSRVSGIIETTLVVTLSVVIGAVLVSVLLPLVSMISSIGA